MILPPLNPIRPLRRRRPGQAFSLVELLVVMAVIGILAAIGLPALKGMGGSNDIGAATRQLLDDLSYARIKAINERTTVYVVFVSDSIAEALLGQPLTKEQQNELGQFGNLRYTSYALYTKRSLGDQPGPGRSRYITDWRTLPEGTFIPTNKFNLANAYGTVRTNQPLVTRPFFFGDDSANGVKYKIPFPNATNKPINLPFIAFDYRGRLVHPENIGSHPHDVIVPIVKGSIVYPEENKAKMALGLLDPAEAIETPKGNYTNNPSIRIDWLTGRARVVRPEKLDYVAKQ